MKVSIPGFVGSEYWNCGDREEYIPFYGILIPSPSYKVGPLGRSGAGIAERVVRGRTDAGAEYERTDSLWRIRRIPKNM